MKKSYYKRWVDIFGDSALEDLLRIAKKHMEVPYAGKPGICCWWGFYLYGTKDQLKEVEKDWSATGAKVYNRKPRGAWGIPEIKVTKRK